MFLLAWYFLAISVLPYGGLGVTQLGPFPDRAAVGGAMKFVRAQQPDKTKYPVVLFGPWSDGK